MAVALEARSITSPLKRCYQQEGAKQSKVWSMSAAGLQDPVFGVYVIAASAMILKAVSMSWLTVWRMLRENGGFRSPEDLRRTPLNPRPAATQLDVNERVERVRRIQLNDLESIPYFLVVGWLFTFTEPSLLAARLLFFGYVATRLAHFVAYLTGQSHDVRAALWTPGSLIVIYMATKTLLWASGF